MIKFSYKISYSLKLLNIFLFEVNFDKSIIGLHLFIIFSMLAKFLKKLKINIYVINKLFKLQVFLVLNYA